MKWNNHHVSDIKMAYIGGGSKAWAWKLMADLALEPALDGTVWLYDIDARAAEENQIIGSQLKERKEAAGRWDYKVAYSLKEALKGADFLGTAGVSGPVLMVIFILFSGAINLLMGSASAKWTILAPVFVPMFMLLGYSPELTQVAYRIGDSCTNLITPLMSYFAMVVVFAKKYDSESGIGTLIATMLPYSIFFMIGWSVLLILWMVLGLPLGPGASLMI